MPIRDNRFQLTDAESLAPAGFPGEWVDEVGGNMTLNLDTDTFIEGVSSIADQSSNNRIGIGWHEDANRDWSNSVFYIWMNCTVANKLALKRNGGIAVRFSTIGFDSGNWFEVYVDGSDTYFGGYKMLVVDIEEARRLAIEGFAQSPHLVGTHEGGSPEPNPAGTSALRNVTVMFETLSNSPGASDNCFVDAIWRLPLGQPGVIVSGKNTDVSPNRPWNWADIRDAGDNTDVTKAWGVISEADGVFRLNTPVQFGSDGSPDDGDHDFEDSNVVIAWESQIVLDGFYGFTVVGDSVNTQRFVAGVKTGSGDDAVGSQGWVVTAASDGPRWFIDCFDANIDDAQWQGCTLIHSMDFDLDNLNTEMRSCQLIDGQRIDHSTSQSPRSGAQFQKNTIIAADPRTFLEGELEEQSPNDDVAYIHTADPDKIKNNTFLFSGEHAILMLDDGTYAFPGNVFTGFGAEGTKDAALHYDPIEPQGDLVVETDPGDVPAQNTNPAFRFNDIAGSAVLYDGVSGIRFVDVPISRRISQPQFDSPDDPIFIQIWAVTDLTNDNPTAGDVALATSEPRFVSELVWGDSIPSSPTSASIMRFTFDPPFTPSSPASAQSPLMLWIGVFFEGENSDASPQDGITVGMATPSPEHFSTLDVRVKAGSPQPWTPNWGTFPNWYKGYAPGVVPGELTLNVSDAATPTMHNPVSPENVTINNNVSVTLTGVEPGTEIRVYPSQADNSPQDLTEIDGIESVGSPAEFTFSGPAGMRVDIVVLHVDFVLPPENRIEDFTIPTTSTSFPISQLLDRNFSNPA